MRSISQGSERWVTLRRHDDVPGAIADLHRRGYRVWASHLDPAAVPLEDLPLDRPTALLLGNEHEGVSPDGLAEADGTYVIPMRGFVQSMNISVAAAVSVHHVTRAAREVAGARYGLTATEKRELLSDWMRRHLPRGRPLPPSALDGA
jgi:tRNA (guanosine-2'-O-)-methyltransferase